MPRRRFGTFSGGIDLPDEKAATLDAPIVPVGPLETLRVPLAPLPGEPARLLARPGQYVTRGERLAEAANDRQVDVFAPLAGEVAGVAEALLPAGLDEWRTGPAVELVALDPPADIQSPPARRDWTGDDAPSLRRRIADGGLTTGGERPRSLARWIDAARLSGADVLIANVMENTPFVTADHRLLAERGSEVVHGLAILARAMEIDQVMLAVDQRRA